MKKLNLAIITLLLVFQTVLSPISVLAEDTGSSVPPAVEANSDEPTSNSPETGNPDATVPTPGDTGNPDATVPTPGETGNPDATVPTPGETGEVDGSDANTGGTDNSTVTPPEESDKVDGAESEANAVDGEKDKNAITLEETAPPSYEPTMSTEVIKYVKFTVNNEVVSANQSINVTNGQSAEFEFHLDLKAGHNYGPGTTLTYTLPAIFENIAFPNGTTYGDVGTISKNGNDIVITFNEALRDDLGTGVALEPNAFFMIQADFASGNTKWDETISLIGVEDVQLNFQPKPFSGETISKSGTPDNDGKNSKFINWIVKVNTNLGVNEVAGVTKFVDTLKGAHNFKQDEVTITKLNVLPNGAVIDSSDSVLAIPTFDKDKDNNDRMTIDLPNEKYTAYRITYQTEVGDPGNVDKAYFENNATYNGKSDSEKVPVEFGAPLAKSHEGPDESNLETTWTINYNFNNRNITSENAVLTDAWTDSQELVGTVQVFMADGITPADITSDVVYKDIDDNPINNGFKLTFSDTVTKPYVIKYKTKPKANIYPTSDLKVTNTVKRSDMVTTISDKTTYKQNELLLKKSTNGIDYNKKEMSWKIEANQAGYSLAKDTVFTDTFTDKNLSLIENTLVVIEGSKTLEKDIDYTLDNNNKDGFTITLLKATNKPIVITYDTKYDITHVGTNEIQYRNNVQMTNSVLPNATSDSDEQKIKDEQKANGQKNGYYDYATKKFYWNVELNFNYNELTNAVFEDILPDTQTIQNIVVKKGALNASGIFEEEETLTISNDSGKKNEIKLKLGKIEGPVKVTYESVDADGIFPHGSPVSITNTAALTSDAGNNASWTKTVNVSHTNKILSKNGKQAAKGSAAVNWNFKFNYAQSTLDNVVITDTVGKDNEGNPEQMILEDTFKVYKVALSGKTPNNPTENKTLLDPSEYTLNVDMKNGTFTLNLGAVREAYYVEYETVFTGTSGSTVANEVEVKYLGSSQTSGNDSWSIANFKYGNQASTVKVPFVIVKTNAATGEAMKDVEFTLYSQYTGNKPLISDKTDANGLLDFGLMLAEGQYTVKETKVDGFENPDVNFTLDRNNKATSGTFAGKQIVGIANKPESPLKCSKYELTVYDIDGNVTNGGKITLVNKATDMSVEYSLGTDGKISFTPDQVKAGQYDVKYNGVTLKTITIQYNDECGESIQPAPKCDNFTIAIEDTEGNIRTNIKELTLKSGTTEAKVSPNAAGKFVFASNKINPTDGIKPGDYMVYEGNLFLGTVNLTYAENCGHEFIVKQAPKCETFKLTVKDVDGKLVADGTSVTVKDTDDKIVATKTTTNGVLELTNLQPGIYKVEVNGKENGSFQSNIDCEATVQPAPSCPIFTLTVKDENGNVRPNVSNIMIKDKNGATIASNKTTDAVGQVTMPSQDIPSGDYSVYQGDLFIGQITVQYSVHCQAEIVAAPTCPSFTLTVQTAFGTPLANAIVTVKDVKGNTIKDANGNDKLTTTVAGTIVLPDKAIQQGTYNVYEGSRLIGSFVVKDTCSALVKPSLPGDNGGGGGGGSTPPEPGKPVDPNKPTPEPGKPVDPNKPTPEPGKPVDPNKPTPEPGKPVDPNKPTPEPGKPVDPNKPTPDPEQPVNPENPSTNTEEPSNPGNPSTDSKDPTAPGKTDTSKPSVQDVIDQGKNLPSINPSTANKDTLDAYKDFINNYNQLSKEEQEEIAKSLDIDKIKADAKRLETQLQAQGKLPQTDGANQTALTLTGVALVLGALFFLRRRKAEMK